jgi:hypothetical protein
MSRLRRSAVLALLVGLIAGLIGVASAGPALASPQRSGVASIDPDPDPDNPPVALLTTTAVTIPPGQRACTDPFDVLNGVEVIAHVDPTNVKVKLQLFAFDGTQFVKIAQKAFRGDIDQVFVTGPARLAVCIKNPPGSGTPVSADANAFPF